MIAPLFGSITRTLLSPLVSGLRDELFGAFTPRSLFNDGSIGVLYDNNDLTTMFVDAAGTTPATVNGLVGLQLDKSQGAALGAELTTNGDFASDTWWSKSDVTVTISGGTGNFTASTAGQAIFRSSLFVIGGYYEITYTVTSVSAGGVRLHDGGNFGPTRSTPGTYTERWLTIGPNFFIIATGASTTASIDNVSVKRVLGNHRYQTTTGSKPILRGTPTGGNLVTNGNFASGTGWAFDAGWSIGSGVASFTATGSQARLTQALALGASKVYRVTYTVVSRSAGSVLLRLAGGAVVNGASRSAAGTYVEYLTTTTTISEVQFFTSIDFTGSVDNLEIVDVSAGSVTAPYGLQYDGVDDFLQTASVNFSATDKMFVCAGVRKLSDAARATLFELANNQINAFRSEAPYSAGPVYNFGSGGSAGIVNAGVASGYAAPITNVLTGIGNISGDVVTLRINGVEVTSTLTDQGTGNYQNAIIYFGRRGGISQPLNGLDFGMVIVGKTLTAAQISSTERWMAQRTGVSI